jgi:hypothetical protein
MPLMMAASRPRRPCSFSQEKTPDLFKDFLHLPALEEDCGIDAINVPEHSGIFALHPGDNHQPDNLQKSGH